jgi:hypothetical protein
MKKNYLPILFFLATASLLLMLAARAQDTKATTNSQAGKTDSIISAPEASTENQDYRDLYSDTWVGTDALGRTMPGYAEVGPVKSDHRRVVGMFYITWHDDQKAKLKAPYAADVTRILAADPNARQDAKTPLWAYDAYHWGEPEAGYFLSKDKYVVRRDMAMLSDAGVDVLIMDVTNAVSYWDEWDTIFSVMEEMKLQGNKVPKICFWTFNGPVITVVQGLYDRIYKGGKYKDLWYYWDGKPLLLYNGMPNLDANGAGVKNPNPHYDSAALTDKNNPHYGDPDYSQQFYADYTREVKDFFTLRTMWWGYYEWNGKRFVGTQDDWSFGYDLGNDKVKAMNPDGLLSIHDGIKEEAAVTPAQHPSSLVGKSWTRESGEPALDEHDLPASAYVPWLGKSVQHPEGYGIYFQQRWDEAIKSDPQFIYINDWNEWVAGKYAPGEDTRFPFMRRASSDNSYFFVDQYNAEFNRSIQPMKGGYTDNYYMQMAENIRRYKGVRPIPVSKGFSQIKIDADFSDWDAVKVEYRDAKGDTVHRDYDGYGGLHYVDNSGRNDIVTAKVAVDNHNVYFYAETADALTPSNGRNWMLLLIDADRNSNTGWFGYDYVIDYSVIDAKHTTLMHYEPHAPNGPWVKVATLNYRYKGSALEIEVPRKLLGLKGNAFSFDFHWADNPTDLKDPISLCISGDSAPDRRFNYRFIWEK